MTPVRLEPGALRSRVKHSTTEPLRSLQFTVSFLTVNNWNICPGFFYTRNVGKGDSKWVFWAYNAI